jgi:DNA-binding beta-propeller fold protein YncE
LKFDEHGKLVKSFGAGLVIWPHGIHVDKDGNIWVTDAKDNGLERKIPPLPSSPPPDSTRGHQVFKFSPEGKLLLTLGKPGGAAAPDYFFEPNDVITSPNGDVFVSEGHASLKNRILKFDRNGKFIKAFGQTGSAPAEFRTPHGLAFDSQGRLFVADRSNNRIQIFDQDGNFISEYRGFGRPSGLFIDKDDMLYAADSESNERSNPGWSRGIYIGSAKDGVVKYFIPEVKVEIATPGTSAAEGVAVDARGNVYGAEVGAKRLMRYTLNKIAN